MNQVVREDGEYRLYIGTKEIRIPVKAGDMFEEMHYDYADAVRYAAQVFRQAAAKSTTGSCLLLTNRIYTTLPLSGRSETRL